MYVSLIDCTYDLLLYGVDQMQMTLYSHQLLSTFSLQIWNAEDSA